MINVKTQGAVGDGVVDDRAAIQASLNAGAGDIVYFPNGRYLCGKGVGTWCLTVPPGTMLLGETRSNAVIVQSPGVSSSVRLIEIDTANVTLQNLTLEGDRTHQTPDEHRSGVFANAATGLVLRNITSQNFTGDGFYIYVGSHSPTIIGCLATGNGRNGITFGGGTVGGTIINSQFVGNVAQQFDSEPAYGQTVDGLTVTGCTFDGAGISSQYVMTCAGSGTAMHSRNWTVTNSTFFGGVEAVWFDDLCFAGNTVSSPTTSPAFTVYRSCNRITIDRCLLSLSGAANEVVAIFCTGINQTPADITVSNCALTTNATTAHGVYIISARSVEISNNVMSGSDVARAYCAGVLAKTSVVGEDIVSLNIHGNTISNFGQYGVCLTSSGGAVTRQVDITNNSFGETTNVMSKALSLGAGNDVRQAGNTLSGGCTTLVSLAPGGVLSQWGQRWLVP